MNNTPITPGHPNMNFTSTADKKLKKVTTNEDPAYNLNTVQSEFSLKNNQMENQIEFLRRKVLKMELKK